MCALLYDSELDWADERGAAWCRSSEPDSLVFAAFAGGGPLANKKWPLNEESAKKLIV